MIRKSYIAQVWAVFTGTLAALSDGMHVGWTSPITPILLSPDTPVVITEDDELYLENILLFGAMCGLPTTIYLVDKIGRKRSILTSAVAGLVTWILIAVGNRVEYYYVARFLAGMAGNMAFVAAPMFIAEISEEKIRGFLSGIIFIMLLIGNLIIYSIAPFVKVYVSSMVPFCILLLMLCTFTFIPESPYYLLLKNKQVEAEKSLKWFRASDNVENELKEITAAVARQNSEQGTVKDLLGVPSNRKALFILLLVNFGENFGGVNVMFMNMHLILEAGGSVYLETKYAAIIYAVCMLTAGTITVSLVDKVGRKLPLILSSLFTGITLTVLATYFALKNSGTDTTSFSWVPILIVMLYAVFYKCGLGIIPIILLGELFPTSVKAMGMTLADCSHVVFGIISLYVYLPLARYYGMHVPFFVFSACCFVLTVIYAICIPETKGKTLEEIQLLLKGIKSGSNKK